MVGKTSVGKTTLIQALKKETLVYKKTQAIDFYDDIIDIPGEYLEIPRYINAIITLSFEVDIVALIHDVDSDMSYFSPHFGDMFNAIVIGIITKVDLTGSHSDLTRAKDYLEQAGAKEIYEVSALTGVGIDQIRNLLKK
jgi:ethanolamine utilization protein EutP